MTTVLLPTPARRGASCTRRSAPTLLAMAATLVLAACGDSTSGPLSSELPDGTRASTPAASGGSTGTGSLDPATVTNAAGAAAAAAGAAAGTAMGAATGAAGTVGGATGTGTGTTTATGKTYDTSFVNATTGDKVGITVFEPTNLAAGQTYPLVLHSHGYAGSRAKANDPNPVADITALLAAGYGVISISERGSDDSTGTIRVMDPDYEGKDLIGVLDWAEANLKWLRYGTGIDGSANNLVVGSIGGSYGGMYQYLINNIDPKHRLDAMVVQYAPNDLTYSLFPNNTIKAGWDSILFADGNTAGSTSKANTDPYITNFFTKGLSTNTVSDDGRDFFYYHSNQYFLGTRTVAGNGTIGGTAGQQGSGTALKPGHPPVHPVKTNALLFQGMRDTLFNFNEAYANYQGLKSGGGDVRLLTYQTGHNALQVVPDPGTAYQPAGNFLDTQCGNVDVTKATIAYFDEYLKGTAGSTNKVVPTQNCLSLTKGDAVLVNGITTGTSGTVATIPSTTIPGLGLDLPTAIPLKLALKDGDVIGGIPHVQLTVAKMAATMALPGEPFVFVGIGQTRNGVPNAYDLIDNQVTPLRGEGTFDVDLIGVAERLKTSDTSDLYLLVYSQHDQYHVTGSVNAASPTPVPVTVAGKVWVPMLGNLPNIVPAS